jgi:cbb3-type cytochrome oxidase cytochrome c subunit
VATLFLVALFIFCVELTSHASAAQSPVERGRLVYLSEGCITCHFQNVRPNTADGAMRVPVENLDELHRQRPQLIGNRQQGPDLSEVGGRRSPLWLKAHLFDPAEVSGASIMPSFARLFRDQRGNDLVAYLSNLHGSGSAEHRAEDEKWHLSPVAMSEASLSDGQRLYVRYCATCHSANGRTRHAWRSRFTEQPAILAAGALKDNQPASSEASKFDHLAQIVKFGIADSDMAGHEYMSDKDIASIGLWLSQNVAQPGRNSILKPSSGADLLHQSRRK